MDSVSQPSDLVRNFPYDIHHLSTAGILHILLLCPADIIRPYMVHILRTVEWLIGCQDADGNWPTTAPTGTHTEHGSGKELVQYVVISRAIDFILK